MPARLSVAVVGSGLMGACCAFWLQRGGAEVTVLDADLFGAQATRAGAGLMQPVTGRRARLAPWHAEGLRETLSLVREVDPDGRLHRVPGVLRAAMDDDQAALWEKGASTMDPEIARWVDREEAMALGGAVSRGCRGGIHVKDGSVVHMLALAEHLLRISGVRVLRFIRVRDVTSSGRLVTLLGKRRKSPWRGQYDRVVLAAGIGTAPLLERLGATELADQLVPARGETAVFSVSETPRMVISSGGYVIPLEPGLIRVGATFDEREPWLGVTPEGLEELELRARHLLPAGCSLYMRTAEAGVRPATRDRVPRVGPVDDKALVHLCTGHGAKGLLLGPLSARWLAQAILTEEVAIPARWRP